MGSVLLVLLGAVLGVLLVVVGGNALARRMLNPDERDALEYLGARVVGAADLPSAPPRFTVNVPRLLDVLACANDNGCHRVIAQQLALCGAKAERVEPLAVVAIEQEEDRLASREVLS